jgi:transcriptional regulator with XRE-family HTH domain
LPIVAITLVTIRELPIGARTTVRKSVALTLLTRRKAPPIAAALTLRLVGWSIDERLRRIRRDAGLRLKSMLRLRVSVLPLGRRSETIRQRAEIAIVLKVVALALSGRSLLTALCERLSSLGSGNKSEVVFRVLQIIFRRDRVSARVSVSRELEIFFCDMMRIAAYFDVRPI